MKSRIFVTGVILLAALCRLSPAQTVFTDTLGDHDYNNPANWSNGFPGANGGGNGTVNGLAVLTASSDRPLGAYQLNIGSETRGELIIPAGLTLRAGDDMHIGFGINGRGTVQVYGTLTVAGGGVDSFIGDLGGVQGEIIVHDGGFFDGRKAIEILGGRVYYSAHAVPTAVQDEFVVGNDGTVTFETDGATVATVAGSTLVLELGSTSTLELVLSGEFNIGDSWTLFTGISAFSGVNGGDGDGTFGQVVSPQGFDFDIRYDTNAGTVTATLVSAGALPVQPANLRNVPVDTILEWKPGSVQSVSGYDLYFTDDPNELATARVLTRQLQTRYTPTLEYGTTYYWKVDVYEPNAPGPDTLHEGGIWSFTTEPPDPLVLSGPEPFVIVRSGESARFSITTQNAEFYQWYRVGDSTPLTDDGRVTGTDSATLTINEVSQADEGQYYCKISNSLTPVSHVSDTGRLMTRRLVGHWTFEDTLTDTVDGWIGRFIDASTETEEPAPFVEGGIAGKAIQFDNNFKVVRVDQEGAADYFNFFPLGLTVSAWVKADEAVLYATAVSKQDNGGSLGWMLRCPDTGSFNIKEATQAIVSSPETLVDGSWHMITGQYDGEVTRLYVDGVLVATSAPNTNPLTPHGDPLTFGAARPRGDGGFKGMVDEVMIWNYAADPYEIAQVYADYSGRTVCVEISPYDLNGDCIVNVEDLQQLLDQWMLSHLIHPNP